MNFAPQTRIAPVDVRIITPFSQLPCFSKEFGMPKIWQERTSTSYFIPKRQELANQTVVVGTISCTFSSAL